MASVMVDTGTLLTFLREPKRLTRNARQVLGHPPLDGLPISVETLIELRRMQDAGQVSDEEVRKLVQVLRFVILPIDDVTFLLAETFVGPETVRLIAATARRNNMTLLATTDACKFDGVDVIASVKPAVRKSKGAGHSKRHTKSRD